MKELSVQELKANLSRWLAAVARGEVFVITRHKRPIAQIAPAQPPDVRTGRLFGKANLTRLAGPPVSGVLDTLLDDRRGGRERD